MSSTLKLQVVLQALDKATAPLRGLTKSLERLSAQQRDSKALMRELGKQQDAINNFRKLKAATRQSTSAIKEQQQKVKQLAQEMQAAGTPSKALTQDFKRATKEAARLKQEYASNQQKLQELRSSLNTAGISTKNLSDAELKLRNQIAETNKVIERQGESYKRLSNIKQRHDKLNQRHSNQMQRVAMVGGMGAAGVAVGQKVFASSSSLLAPGIAFGEQMSELQAVSRLNKDDEAFLMLEKQARYLGATTGFTAADAGAGQTFLARAGFSPEAIHASMQDMLNLAAANKMDLGRTADIASNISSVFKIDPETQGNMTRVADVLSGVAARANVDLEMLGETMKYLGGAEDLDISLEQAAAMAGLLGNIGIQGSQAGTTMRAMMNRLTGPSKDAKESMEEIGLEVADAQGKMRDMPDILLDIAKATKDMGNVERKEIITKIFGVEAGSGMTELVSKMIDGDLDKLLGELQNKVTGENAKMARTMEDNIGGDLSSLVSAWDDIGIAMTQANDGPIRQLVQSLTDIVRSVGQWIEENPELVATLGKIVGVVTLVVTVLGGLAVAVATILGPLSVIIFFMGKLWLTTLKILPLFKAVATGFVVMGKFMLANPIFLVIAAIAAGAYLIYRNWSELVEGFKQLMQRLTSAVSQGWNELTNWWNDKAAILAQDWQVFADWLANLWGAMWSKISSLASGIWNGTWQEITEAFKGGIAGVGALILNWSPLGLFYKAFAGVLSWFGLDLPNKFTGFGANLISGLVGGIKNMAGKAKEAISGVGESITGWFKEKLGIHSPSRVFAELGGDTVDGLTLGIEGQSNEAAKQAGQLGKQLIAASTLALAGTAAAAAPYELPLAANLQLADFPEEVLQLDAQPLEYIEKLKAAGCSLARQGKGSHEIWFSPITNKTFPVPHPKKSLPIGTVKSIQKLAGI